MKLLFLCAKYLVRCVSCMTLSVAAIAQTPAPPMTGAGNTIRLHVVVTQHRGEPIAGLPQSDFTVLDNGKPQPITSFRALTAKNGAVKVMILLDAVNIPFTQLAYERAQVESFLKLHDGQLNEPTAVAVLTDTSTEATGFSTDGNQLSQTLEQKEIGLRDLRRSSGFYGAEERLGISLRGLQLVLQRAKAIPGRKIIVWISPGWPLLSGPAVEPTRRQAEGLFADVVGLSREIREADVTLYGLDPLGAQQNPATTFYYEQFVKPVKKMSDVMPGNLGLQVLSIQSGGLALNSSNDVRGLLQRCVQDANAYYDISFVKPPVDAPEAYHHIEVRMTDPNLNARATEGYYSER